MLGVWGRTLKYRDKNLLSNHYIKEIKGYKQGAHFSIEPEEFLHTILNGIIQSKPSSDKGERDTPSN